MKRGGPQLVHPQDQESETSGFYAPRIAPGDYPARSRSAAIYRDPQFKRWVCAVQFDIYTESLLEVLARLTWYLNLGNGNKAHAGKRSNYWKAWVIANGALPPRRCKFSRHVFEGRYATVRVADTAKDNDQKPIDPRFACSVIREVAEWKTGGRE